MSYESALHETQPGKFPNGVNRFISEAYAYLFASLASMALLGMFSYNTLPRSSLLPLGIADGLLWILCGWFGWRNPMQLVFPLFTLITGLLLGQLAHYHPNSFASATIITLIVFAGLTAFVWFTRWDFSFLQGFLCVAFFVLLGGWIAFFFTSHSGFLLGWTGFGVLSFACWILYDTSNILNRHGDGEDTAVAGFELILDIIGFHRWFLDHFNLWDIKDN